MKKLLFALLFLCGTASAEIPYWLPNPFVSTYYIDPSGNDATGTGAIGNPWKTLYKATTTVTTSGDIIHVNAGTYIETINSTLSPGVSIDGDDSATTTITSTQSAPFTPMILAQSSVGTNGNQFINNIRFYGGDTMFVWCAVNFLGRSNVSIRNCSFVNFREYAVILCGQANINDFAAPSTYATGCTFYNNSIYNCAGFGDDGFGSTYGRGAFMYGGTQGLLIHNNSIIQPVRANHPVTGLPRSGWAIKNWNDGFDKGTKIYSNILKRPLFPYSADGVNNYWGFCLELFDQSGIEVYSNTIEGSVDLNRNYIYSIVGYSCYIHDNEIGHSTFTNNEHGIILEFSTKGAIVKNNVIKNVAYGIFYTERSGDSCLNNTIEQNLITIKSTDGSGSGIGHTNDPSNYILKNFRVYNNTIIVDATYWVYWGISMSNALSIDSVTIKNNHIQGTVGGWIVSNVAASSIVNFVSQYNNLYNNAAGNSPQWYGTGGTPSSGYVNSLNINSAPDFDANYHPNTGSPLIDAGVDVGLPYSGSAPDIGFYEVGYTPPPTTSGSGKKYKVQKGTRF